MRPGSEEELAAAVRGAAGPLRITGGGTRAIGAAGPGDLLETGGLCGVVLYEPAALTLVVRAGTPLAEVEALLAAEGQRLAFEPPDFRALLGRGGVSTVGGVAAANASGPRRIQAGACRDALIGARFVDGRGAVLKNGGRVMKNVTGYDLVKLLAGSHGTLGVLTELSFKVQPVPEAVAVLVLPGLAPAAAVAALSAALTSPWDVTGAAHLPGRGTLVRIEGLAQSVSYRAERLCTRLAPWGRPVVERDPAVCAALFAELRDVTPFAGREGAVWRISVKPSDGPEVAARLGGEAILDWGGGLVWVLYPEGEDPRPRLAGLAGHATRLRGAGPAPTFPSEAPAVAALSRRLRAEFDPRGILNPGLMG